MARVGLEGGPPRFYFAACLASLAAFCFIVQGLCGFTAQFIQMREMSGGNGWQRDTMNSCPTADMVAAAPNPWAFDAMLDVDEATGKCTNLAMGGREPPCPTPLAGCRGTANAFGAPYPCCVFNPNATSWFMQWTRLDRETTQMMWHARRDADPFLVAGFAAGSVGWVSTVPGVTCLATVLGSAHRSVAGMMPTAVKAAAILSLVEFTSEIGAAQMSQWISLWPALSVKESHPDSAAEGAVQALEISYLLTTSRTMWLYSADRLLLAATLLSAAFVTFSSSPHVKTMASVKHAALGIFLAFLCIVGFGFDVMRFVSWSVAGLGLALMTLLIEMIFLPIWLLWLACVLRRVSAQGGSYASATSVELGEQKHGDDKNGAPPETAV